MLAFAAAHDIAFDLVIPPVHADLLEIYHHAGLWPRFERWQRDLASLVATEGGPAVRLWDFAAYDAYATEPVPASRAQTMQWFWEPVHFKKPLGALIIRRILGADTGDFGERLTPQNVEARLARVRAQRDDYLASQPQAADRIEALVRRIGAR